MSRSTFSWRCLCYRRCAARASRLGFYHPLKAFRCPCFLCPVSSGFKSEWTLLSGLVRCRNVLQVSSQSRNSWKFHCYFWRFRWWQFSSCIVEIRLKPEGPSTKSCCSVALEPMGWYFSWVRHIFNEPNGKNGLHSTNPSWLGSSRLHVSVSRKQAPALLTSSQRFFSCRAHFSTLNLSFILWW